LLKERTEVESLQDRVRHSGSAFKAMNFLRKLLFFRHLNEEFDDPPKISVAAADQKRIAQRRISPRDRSEPVRYELLRQPGTRRPEQLANGGACGDLLRSLAATDLGRTDTDFVLMLATFKSAASRAYTQITRDCLDSGKDKLP
jgi:hypothetical protein